MAWENAGSHYVDRIGRKCKLEVWQDADGLWRVAVLGHFSTYGVTRGNAIRNACKPVDPVRAKQSLDDYNAHRRGELSDKDYFAGIERQHERNLKEFWADARAHGEA